MYELETSINRTGYHAEIFLDKRRTFQMPLFKNQLVFFEQWVKTFLVYSCKVLVKEYWTICTRYIQLLQ